MIDKITIENIEKCFLKKGYVLYDSKLNIIGVRSNDMTPDKFNDFIVLLWQSEGAWSLKTFRATTDAGLYYLNNPMNVNGTAILVPSQYLDVYAKGLHKGYPALQQMKKMKYWRDNNKDNRYDINGKVFEQIGGTNIHHAGADSQIVGKWSAGCQVIASMKDWGEFMNVVDSFVKKQDLFTYTLITEDELA